MIDINAPAHQYRGNDRIKPIFLWQANVLQLQSQLLLAKPANDMQPAKMEALQLSNHQYKEKLDSQQKDRKEEIIKGVLSVGMFEFYVVEADLGEIFRRLKKYFVSISQP